MKYRFGKKDQQYWANALIALSQVTFGVAWALIFAPIDDRKINLVILNVGITIILLILGWWSFRKS